MNIAEGGLGCKKRNGLDREKGGASWTPRRAAGTCVQRKNTLFYLRLVRVHTFRLLSPRGSYVRLNAF